MDLHILAILGWPQHHLLFRWRYSPLWALACRTIPLNLSLSITNSFHLLTPNTWRSLSSSSLHSFLGLPLCLVTSSSWVKKTSASVQFISKKEKQDTCWGLPRTDHISMPRACIGLQLNTAKHMSDRAEGLFSVMSKNTRYTYSWINLNNVQWQNIVSWQGHCTDFISNYMLYRTSGYMDHLVKEATEMWLNTENFKTISWFHINLHLVSCNQNVDHDAGPSRLNNWLHSPAPFGSWAAIR